MLKINEQIASFRKSQNITQEQLANLLGVTNQAVSKWESGQNCPDIILIPEIARIFNVTIDELFGQSTNTNEINISGEGEKVIIAIEKDGKLINHQYLTNKMIEKTITIKLEGELKDVESYFNLEIHGNINGNAKAGDSINCNGNIGANANAGDELVCHEIIGNASAGDSIKCVGSIGGNANAGDNIICGGSIKGNANTGDNIHCQGDIYGNATSRSIIKVSGEIKGDIIIK